MRNFIIILFSIITHFTFASSRLPIITFQTNSLDTIRESESEYSIRQEFNFLAKTFEDNPTITIKLLGYASPDENLPLELSVKRAELVKDILVHEYGIYPEKLVTVGKILDDDSNVKQTSLHRSVVFYILNFDFKTPETILSIKQKNLTINVNKNTDSISLEASPFVLEFETKNCNAVLLCASLDSTAYYQTKNSLFKELTCILPSHTFAEPSKNQDLDLSVTSNIDRGYHCLFAHSVDVEFIRFDSVLLKSKDDWTGIRTINQLDFIGVRDETNWKWVKGKTIYLTYSADHPYRGKSIKIIFE